MHTQSYMPIRTTVELLRLAKKYVKGTATPEEKAALDEYYQLHDSNPDGLEYLSQEEKNLLKIRSRSITTETIVSQRSRLVPMRALKTAMVAAAMLGFIFFTYKFLNTSSPKVPSINQIANTKIKTTSDIVPGTDKATLTLADGKRIEIDSAGNGLVAQQGNVRVMGNGSQLSYHAAGTTSSEILMNTISTPRGGQYKVVLADGTMVWLNAASSLEFPVSFTNSTREVTLNGEAYFEVAKDASKPFHVRTNGINVEVLGTHFNIMSYCEEGKVATTLLEGSVKVSKDGNAQVMRPGQQASWSSDNKFTLSDHVDMDAVISWKNGRFYFNNTDIKTIMRQISRWYNVDIVFEGRPVNVSLGGIMSRKENVSQLLELLEATGKVHFKIEGKKIIITQ